MASAAALEVYKSTPEHSTSLDLAQTMISSCRSAAKQAADVSNSEGLSITVPNDRSVVFLMLQVSQSKYLSCNWKLGLYCIEDIKN